MPMPSNRLYVELMANGELRIIMPKSQSRSYTALANEHHITTEQALCLASDLYDTLKISAVQNLEDQT